MTDEELETLKKDWDALMFREQDNLILFTSNAVPKLLAEVDRLRSGFEAIKKLGSVCPEFEICGHAWCRDSAAAWHIADLILYGLTVPERQTS